MGSMWEKITTECIRYLQQAFGDDQDSLVIPALCVSVWKTMSASTRQSQPFLSGSVISGTMSATSSIVVQLISIPSIFSFVGWPVKASQGLMMVTGISVIRHPQNSVPSAPSPYLSGILITRTDLTYKLRISHIDNSINVYWNDEAYISVLDSTELDFGLSSGSIGFFDGRGIPLEDFEPRDIPTIGSKKFLGPAVRNLRLNLVNTSDANETRTAGKKLMLAMRACPPPSSSDACGDMQIFFTRPPDPPEILGLEVIDQGVFFSNTQSFRQSWRKSG